MEMAYVILTSALGLEYELLKVLRAISGVREVFMVRGVYDVILKVEADTMVEIKELLNKIRMEEKVRSAISMIVI